MLGLIRGVLDRSQKYKALATGITRTHQKNRLESNIINVWLKRFFSTPALFGNHCSQPYGWCTIPARAQSLTIIAFLLLNIIACLGSYRLTDGNIYWPEKSAQLLRYLSDRTGIVALANFPLIWLFGMRNDVVLWLTGWGFGTFNAFHRWIARIATVEAVIHSLGYTLMIWEDAGWNGFWRYWTKHYFWNGELSTIAMCALLVFSVYGIRRAHYEVFLVTHIVLSIVTLWTMYYHVEIFVDGEWNIFILPCLAIWIFDRALRGTRVLCFNWQFWDTRASILYDPSSNLIKMEVRASRCLLPGAMQKPGSYYYIYVLSDVLHAHQSHPFTMAYVSSTSVDTTSTQLRPILRRENSSEYDSLLSTTTDNSSSMVFLIRPYDGFTARLKSQCLLHPTNLRVLVEGPYGQSESLHTFTNVLFVVGGTGIAIPLSHLAALLSSQSTVQSLKIVWAVRQHTFLTSVMHEFQGLLADERVEMEVHVTRREDAYDDVLGEELRNVRLMAGRPEVHMVVRDAAEMAGKQSLAIVACGPAVMADEIRRASVNMLAAGHSEVEYFEESFQW
jgi:predicted ferric reductase